MDNDFLFPATVPLDYETHGGDDVAVFSIGPWSHLFTGKLTKFMVEKFVLCKSHFDLNLNYLRLSSIELNIFMYVRHKVSNKCQTVKRCCFVTLLCQGPEVIECKIDSKL